MHFLYYLCTLHNPMMNICNACENAVFITLKRIYVYATNIQPWTFRLSRLSLCSYTVFADRNFEIGISVRWSQNDGKFSPDELWQGKYDVVLKRSQRITNECYMGSSSPALPRRPSRVLFCGATVTILQLPRCFQLPEKKGRTRPTVV